MNISNIPIPAFPVARPITLSDKPLLDAVFADLQPCVSELTFAGLYLFRKAHDYSLSVAGNSIVVLGKGYDGLPRFLPPLRGDVSASLEQLLGAGLMLYGADSSFAESFLCDESLLVTVDRDSSDYLYLRRDLAELPGNRYHKKKNRINYFTSRHDHTVELFSESLAPACLDLLKEWVAVSARGGDGDSSGFESEAAAESLMLAGQLGLEGVVVLVDGKVKAFALGERLNSKTSVCHFEKSDPFMEGVSQLVDREFNRLLFADCTYVNREQDLGLPGLRTAKLSYHPVEMVDKFCASRTSVHS